MEAIKDVKESAPLHELVYADLTVINHVMGDFKEHIARFVSTHSSGGFDKLIGGFEFLKDPTQPLRRRKEVNGAQLTLLDGQSKFAYLASAVELIEQQFLETPPASDALTLETVNYLRKALSNMLRIVNGRNDRNQTKFKNWTAWYKRQIQWRKDNPPQADQTIDESQEDMLKWYEKCDLNVLKNIAKSHKASLDDGQRETKAALAKAIVAKVTEGKVSTSAEGVVDTRVDPTDKEPPRIEAIEGDGFDDAKGLTLDDPFDQAIKIMEPQVTKLLLASSQALKELVIILQSHETVLPNSKAYRWDESTSLQSLQELQASNELAKKLQYERVDGAMIRPLTNTQIYRSAWYKIPQRLRDYLPPLLPNPSEQDAISQLINMRKLLSTHSAKVNARVRAAGTDTRGHKRDRRDYESKDGHKDTKYQVCRFCTDKPTTCCEHFCACTTCPHKKPSFGHYKCAHRRKHASENGKKPKRDKRKKGNRGKPGKDDKTMEVIQQLVRAIKEDKTKAGTTPAPAPEASPAPVQVPAPAAPQMQPSHGLTEADVRKIVASMNEENQPNFQFPVENQ